MCKYIYYFFIYFDNFFNISADTLLLFDSFFYTQIFFVECQTLTYYTQSLLKCTGSNNKIVVVVVFFLGCVVDTTIEKVKFI